MLDGVELEQVQEIKSVDSEAVETHGVPALEGDFLQDLGRRAVRITLNGAVLGPAAGDGLKTLREKFRGAKPVAFVSDIATATKVDQVLIEDFGVREIAGKPQRFEYALTLREFIPAPPPATEPPPVKPPPPTLVATLIVDVIVKGQPAFDFGKVTVTVEGTQDDKTKIAPPRVLAKRANNEWTETPMPPGNYTVRATVSDPPMAGSASAKIGQGETVKVTIELAPGKPVAKMFVMHFWFDRAFVEPCLREVAQQVAKYASEHPAEKLVIVGNTDLAGSDDYNQSLSERRGRSVYAMLTSGRDKAGALAEWGELRKPALGALPTVHDSWKTREYQFMLQDLDSYSGNIDEQHGTQTDAGVRAFQKDHKLPVTGFVDDATWAALIEAYLGAVPLAVPESQFLRNAKKTPSCDGGILKWLGCGEKHPVKNTQDAWRPNRRTELLFVAADKLPCEVAKPVTFELAPPGGSSWCLGGGDPNKRCCFISRDGGADGGLPTTPAEPGSFTVRGSIKSGDGTPLANAKYVLTAPDGEYMDGEHPSAPNSGRPIPGRTKADGTFAYPTKPKGPGIFILTVLGPFVVRRAADPPGSEKGNSVCMHLDGTAPFDAIVAPAETGDPRRKLRGTLFGAFGAPLKNTPVNFTFEDGSAATATTNDQGKFVADMSGVFATAKIQYALPSGVTVTEDFFIDVQDVSTAEGVKRRLENLGYPAEDDIAAAIVGFQAAQGLDTTGVVDDATRAKLVNVHDGGDPLVPPFPVDQTPLPPSALRGVGD